MKHWNAGEQDAAADVFYRAVPLMRFEFQEGIGMAIRKEVLRRRGALASAATRRAGRGARQADAGGARSRAHVGDLTERHGMDLGLKGKVAMVGGASRGLGYAVAEALAREGAIVSISSTTQASIDEARGSSSSGDGAQVLATPVDVRNARSDRGVGAEDDREVRRRRSALHQCRRAARRRRPLSFDDAAWQNAVDLLLFSTIRMVRRRCRR